MTDGDAEFVTGPAPDDAAAPTLTDEFGSFLGVTAAQASVLLVVAAAAALAVAAVARPLL